MPHTHTLASSWVPTLKLAVPNPPAAMSRTTPPPSPPAPVRCGRWWSRRRADRRRCHPTPTACCSSAWRACGRRRPPPSSTSCPTRSAPARFESWSCRRRARRRRSGPRPTASRSVRTATVCPKAASTVAHVVAVPTWPGALRLVVVPSPSCPSRLRPQLHIVPSVADGQRVPVAAGHARPVRRRPDLERGELVRGGAVADLAVEVEPQAHNVPSVRTPMVCP